MPSLSILLLTDPINDVYGGAPSPLLAELRKAGIEVVVTDLERLRDSNPFYSSLWRTLLQWWGNSADRRRHEQSVHERRTRRSRCAAGSRC